MKRGKTFANACLVMGVTLGITACQAVFTFSPLSFLKRDPASLSVDQQKAYAENALASGDAEAVKAAYAAISAALALDPTNSELNLLAADLAIEASGVSAVTYALINTFVSAGDSASSVDYVSVLNQQMNAMDTAYLANLETYVSTAEANGGAVSSDQYVMTGLAVFFLAADSAGGVEHVAEEDLEKSAGYLQKGADALEAQGVSSSALDGLSALLTGMNG